MKYNLTEKKERTNPFFFPLHKHTRTHAPLAAARVFFQKAAPARPKIAGHLAHANPVRRPHARHRLQGGQEEAEPELENGD